MDAQHFHNPLADTSAGSSFFFFVFFSRSAGLFFSLLLHISSISPRWDAALRYACVMGGSLYSALRCCSLFLLLLKSFHFGSSHTGFLLVSCVICCILPISHLAASLLHSMLNRSRVLQVVNSKQLYNIDLKILLIGSKLLLHYKIFMLCKFSIDCHPPAADSVWRKTDLPPIKTTNIVSHNRLCTKNEHLFSSYRKCTSRTGCINHANCDSISNPCVKVLYCGRVRTMESLVRVWYIAKKTKCRCWRSIGNVCGCSFNRDRQLSIGQR